MFLLLSKQATETLLELMIDISFLNNMNFKSRVVVNLSSTKHSCFLNVEYVFKFMKARFSQKHL